ncbi:hypothetical protein RIF29_03778 [Crotalaria pallida]|uniref:Uncharacterized protein n=1 Tax=Crotalaria pallida TaxID=3830 RepID=A0AAN9J173_CROPI
MAQTPQPHDCPPLHTVTFSFSVSPTLSLNRRSPSLSLQLQHPSLFFNPHIPSSIPCIPSQSQLPLAPSFVQHQVLRRSSLSLTLVRPILPLSDLAAYLGPCSIIPCSVKYSIGCKSMLESTVAEAFVFSSA